MYIYYRFVVICTYVYACVHECVYIPDVWSVLLVRITLRKTCLNFERFACIPLCELFKSIWCHLQAIRGIKILTKAISKIQLLPSQLTSIHADLCQVRFASPVITYREIYRCVPPGTFFIYLDASFLLHIHINVRSYIRKENIASCVRFCKELSVQPLATHYVHVATLLKSFLHGSQFRTTLMFACWLPVFLHLLPLAGVTTKHLFWLE